jgi:hypothetical protein
VGNDEVLLDAFVSIKPDKDFLSAIDNVTDAAIKRMQEKFGAAVIKGPNVSGSQASGQPNSSLEASAAQAESRREASARRILEITKQIEAANIDLNSGSLDVSKVNTLVRLEKELRSATDQEAIAKKEVLDLNAQISASTQQQIAQQNALTAATQATAAVSQQQIDKLDAEIDRVNKEKVDARQVKSDAAAKVGHAGGKDASDAYLRANQEFLRVEDELNKLIEERRILYAQLTQQQQAAAAATATATATAAAAAANPPANPPAANPPANPPGGNPPANPPANPPGANPPSGPNPPNLGSQFRDVRREVEDLEESLRQLNLVKTEIKTDATKKDLQLIDTQLREINVILQRGAENADPFALQEALDRLPGLEQRLRRLNVDVSSSRSFRQEFDKVSATAKSGIAAETLKSNTTQSQLRGISGDDRTNIITMTYAIKQQQQEVMRLSKMFDGTADSVQNLRRAYEDLQFKQSALNETQETLLNSGSRSFNTLSNNAYQAGQAIEDFAVGYSLNGFAGGIRGAANNVAFLLNDMSRLESVQKALPKGWAQQLPLIAGIGSALAIVVLPKLVEWLESLNDIGDKFEDISEELKESFEDIQFDVKFSSDNSSLKEALKNSTSVLEVLKQINDLQFNFDQKKEGLKVLFEGLNKDKIFKPSDLDQIRGLADQFNAAIETQDIAVQDRLRKRLRVRNADFPILEPLQGNADQFDKLFGFESAEGQNEIIKKLKATLFTMQREIDNASEAAINGTANSGMFIRAQDAITEFQKAITENIGELDLVDDNALESFNNSIGVVKEGLKDAEASARDMENTVKKSFDIAFDGARRKVVELQDQLDLQKAVNLGVNVEFDLDLLALETQINEGRRILNESLEVMRKNLPAGPETDAGIKAFQDEFKARALVDLGKLENKELSEREKLEEKILSLKERQRQSAKFTTLEEFAKNLQINALSGKDEEAKRLKELRDRQDELNESLENSKRIRADIGGINRGEFLDGESTRPRVPQGSAGTGFQPFFGDIMKQFTESALNFQQPDNQQLKPEDIKQAVSDGVREGMKVLSEGFGGKAVDALKNLKGVATAQ